MIRLVSILALLGADAAGQAPEAPRPPAPSAPPLSLEAALATFDRQGFDVLLAEAAVQGAEARETSAGALINPAIGIGAGRSFAYDPVQVFVSGQVSDQALVTDVLSGKRGLRLDAARAALASARSAKEDVRRLVATQVKLAWVDLAAAKAALDLARDAQASAQRALEINRLRFPKVIDEGQLARVETAKLGADQGVDRAARDMAEREIQLAFLMGQRSGFHADVDRGALAYSVPAKLEGATPQALRKEALERRPDVRVARAEIGRAEAEIDLAKRQRFPDIALQLMYQQQGTGQAAANPATVALGLTAPIPLLYQNQGEIARAEADRRTQQIAHDRTRLAIEAEVEAAFARFTTQRRVVERYEQALLERARRARDVTELQFNSGAAPLIDYLDAQRTFIAVSQDYLENLAAYWAAVFRLEQAVGVDLRR